MIKYMKSGQENNDWIVFGSVPVGFRNRELSHACTEVNRLGTNVIKNQQIRKAKYLLFPDWLLWLETCTLRKLWR